VFGGLESIFLFQKDIFLPALENAVAPLIKSSPDLQVEMDFDVNDDLESAIVKKVARVFVTQAAFLKMYIAYVMYVFYDFPSKVAIARLTAC
jgi:hypothetical protein